MSLHQPTCSRCNVWIMCRQSSFLVFNRSKKDRFTITVDNSRTVAQLVRALLANSKVPGSSPGGVTEDFFFLSYVACKC